MDLDRYKAIVQEMVDNPALFAAEGYKYFMEAMPILEKALFPTIQKEAKPAPKPVPKPEKKVEPKNAKKKTRK